MRRWFLPRLPRDPQTRANGLAGVLALSAAGFLYLECPLQPAGAESRRVAVTQRPRPVVIAQQATPAAAGSTSAVDEAKLSGLEGKVALLEAGLKFLQSKPDYTAEFTKQELVDGELLDEQVMSLKVRHEPFSVYLKWLTGDRGREALYVDGANDGEMLVHAGSGFKARLGTLSIDPNGSVALGEARHPVTKAGLLELTKTMLDHHARDKELGRVAKCERLADSEFDGRPCHVYLVEYVDQTASPEYRKSITFIDKEWSAPVYVRNYGWPANAEGVTAEELDEATLVEFYSYASVRFGTRLAAIDFAEANEDYNFRRD